MSLKSLIAMTTGFFAEALGAACGDVDLSGAIGDDDEVSGADDPHPVNATLSPATAMLINRSFILMMCRCLAKPFRGSPPWDGGGDWASTLERMTLSAPLAP